MTKKKRRPPYGDDNKGLTSPIARRKFLESTTSVLFATGLAVGGLQKAKAAEKYSKVDVDYQGSPKGDQSCANCRFWDGAGGCEVVEGDISPDAWCALWIAA